MQDTVKSAFEPMPSDEFLYHYCSNATLAAIIPRDVEAPPTVRLSSLGLSNDSKEGRQIFGAILRLAEQAKYGDRNVLNELERRLNRVTDHWMGLAFCLSDDGDLLSQWRGYAEDGEGVSIGFSRNYLDSLRVTIGGMLVPVQYDDVHLSAAKEIFETIGRVHRDSLDDLMRKGFPSTFYSLKGSAFFEERETRLLKVESTISNANIEYRPVGSRIIPYMTIRLERNLGQSIRRVVLGPKNRTPVAVVQAMLRKAGFKDARVDLSKASYSYR